MVKCKDQKKKKKDLRDIVCEVGEKLLLRFLEMITEFLKNRARPIQWQLAEESESECSESRIRNNSM